MDDWSNDLTPEPARLPPPRMVMDLSASEIWDADQSSLPSLSPDETATFSSDPSLGVRVLSNLHTSVPKHVLSRRPQNVEVENRRTAIAKPTSLRSADKRNVPREIKLDHQLEKIRRKLEEANATIEKMKQEPVEELTRWQKTIEVLSASNTRLTEEAKALQARVGEDAAKYSNMETSLKDAQEATACAEAELQACHAELDAAKAALEGQEQTVEEYTRKYEELEEQLVERSSRESQTLRELRVSNNELWTKANGMEEQNKDLRKQAEESLRALDSKCKECLDLTKERTVLRARAERPASQDASAQTDVPKTRSIEVQTDSNAQIGDLKSTAMSERLTRIREVTERTGLLREQEDEIAQLMEDHEETIRSMERRHNQRLQELEEQAAEEQTSKLQQVRRSLQSEHQKRLDEMEKRHRAELSKERNERSRKVGLTAESLEVALEEVAVATQQLEEESCARATAEASLQQLASNFESERQTLIEQYEHEIGILRANWVDEKELLFDDIQTGCNQVFLDSRRLMLPSSAKPVSCAHLDEAHDASSQSPNLPVSPSNVSAVQSPTSQFEFDWSKGDATISQAKHAPVSTASAISVSKSLAETEAYVLKMLGGTCL
jgi:hypothetical protein